jgi:hypothetical protein
MLCWADSYIFITVDDRFRGNLGPEFSKRMILRTESRCGLGRGAIGPPAVLALGSDSRVGRRTLHGNTAVRGLRVMASDVPLFRVARRWLAKKPASNIVAGEESSSFVTPGSRASSACGSYVRGLKKVQIEMLWACLTHNLQHWIRLKKLNATPAVT